MSGARLRDYLIRWDEERPDCNCDPCKISSLSLQDLTWLADHGWRPTLMDQVCKRQIDRLIS